MIEQSMERDVFNYLNTLRESGVINMFAATPYLVEEFNLNKKDAKEWLMRWMDNY